MCVSAFSMPAFELHIVGEWLNDNRKSLLQKQLQKIHVEG